MTRKTTLITFGLFLLCNFVGFYIGPITGFLVMHNMPAEQIDLLRLQADLGMIAMGWAICAIFSVSSFFMSGRLKWFFLLAPIVMPMIHATILMQGH